MTLNLDRIAAALPSYEIQAEIGRGAWGVVLAAEHRQLGRGVAVKQLPEAFAANPLIQRRFASEARVLASLDHPHIVPIFDYVEDDGLWLLVMELLPGGTVRDRFVTTGIGAQDACTIVLATCAALHYAHAKGILHRDIKPENLLFNASGTLKVTDFGIAKVLGGAETLVTQTGDVLGTPAYMAPEQITGGALTPATDVYAVATMLYELLSGQLPLSDEGGLLAALYRHVYEQPTPLLEVAPVVPQEMARVVMQGLASDPAQRQPSAEDFGVAVAEAADDAWGPGWLNDTELDVVVSKRVARRISNPTNARTGEATPQNVVPLADLVEIGGPLPTERPAPETPVPATTPAARLLATPTAVDRLGNAADDLGPLLATSGGGRAHRRRATILGVVLAAIAVGAVVVFLATRSTGGHPHGPAVSGSTTTNPAGTAAVVFADNFTDRASGWAPDLDQDGTGSAAYQSGGYYVTVLKPLPPLNTFSAASPYTPKLTAMVVTVHATLVTAAASDGAGVRCDQGSRNGLRYTFEVFGNGMWVIFKIDDSGSAALLTGSGAAVPAGGGYSIAGQCRELAGGVTRLAMTVNGVAVGTVTDAHPGGPIGWHAALVVYRSAPSPATVVRFNSFQTLTVSPS